MMKGSGVRRPPLAAAAVVGVLMAACSTAVAAAPGADGRLVFHDDRSIYTAAPSGSDLVKLPQDVPGFGGLSVGAGGTRIAYSASHQVFTVNANGTGGRLLGDGDDPAISPDGRSIAFTRAYGIWVMNADGSGAHSITPGASFYSEYSQPAWSPDGKRLAYTLRRQVGVMNADGSGQTALTAPERYCPSNTREFFGVEPDWSPDGARIVFTGPVLCQYSLGRDIWVMNADGSGKADLIGDNATEDSAPVFSPAGDRIAFSRDTPDGPQLQVMPSAGGALTHPPFAVPLEEGQAWAPAVRHVKITAKLSHARVGRGGSVVVRGAVSPATTGRVTVLVLRGTHVIARRSAALKHSRYRVRYRAKRAGRFTVRASIAYGNGHDAASSRRAKLKVGS